MFFHFSVKGFHVGEVAETLDVILELFPKSLILGHSVFQVVEQIECSYHGTTAGGAYVPTFFVGMYATLAESQFRPPFAPGGHPSVFETLAIVQAGPLIGALDRGAYIATKGVAT
jgi:hypothetical protein